MERKKPVPSNGKVTYWTPIASSEPRGQNPFRATEHRNAIIHGGKKLSPMQCQFGVARFLRHLPLHQPTSGAPPNAGGSRTSEIHEPQILKLIHHTDGTIILHGNSIPHPFLIHGKRSPHIRPTPHHLLLPEIQNTNVTVVLPRKHRSHQQTIIPFQPLKLISIPQRPPQRLVEKINLLPSNLVPNPYPILITPPLTTRKYLVIWTKTQGPCSVTLHLILMTNLKLIPKLPVVRIEQPHPPITPPKPLAHSDDNVVGVNPPNIVNPLVIQVKRRVFIQHPIIHMNHAAMRNATATIRACSNGRSVTRGLALHRTGQP